MKTFKRILIWFFAFVLTLLAAYYQRVTGPTYPLKDKVTIDGKTYDFEFIRSHSTSSDAELKIYLPGADSSVFGVIYTRDYPTKGEFDTKPMLVSGDTLIGIINARPAAGKVEYYIEIYNNGDKVYSNENNHVIIRFKNDVPGWALIPHIFLMFLAMFFAVATGLLAIFNDISYKKIQWWTFFTLLIGGFIFGPIVQKYAFGQYWTGVPFGWDLTDNKVLLAFLVWVIALWINRKEEHRWWTVAAVVVQMIIYLIPHSMFGSTLNPETGEVVQGMINILPLL